MRALRAIVARDLKLALRSLGDMLTLILFFVMIGIIVPFAIGPDKEQLARLAPGIVWIAAFLSSLLGLDRMFRADREDGTLAALHHAEPGLEAVAFAKLLAHWLTAALPLILATPFLALVLNMDAGTFARTLISLLAGTPALTALGAIGAAVTVSLRRGGLIAPVLILPLSVPILIFGVSAIAANAGPDAERAALMFLAGISLVAVALAPFAIALALRHAEE